MLKDNPGIGEAESSLRPARSAARTVRRAPWARRPWIVFDHGGSRERRAPYGESCGQSRVRARVRPHAAMPVRRGVSRGRSIGYAGAAHPVMLSRPPHVQATHRSTRLSPVRVRPMRPPPALPRGRRSLHDPADSQKKVRYLCGLFGHRVDTVATRDGFVEYACHCGHTFLRAESGCQTIRHPLVCVLFGHRIGYLAGRAGFAERVPRLRAPVLLCRAAHVKRPTDVR